MTQCNTDVRFFPTGARLPLLIYFILDTLPSQLWLTYIHAPHVITLVISQASRVREHVLMLANTLVQWRIRGGGALGV